MSDFRRRVSEVLNRMAALFAMRDYMLLWLRLWVAQIFYTSGRTKAGDGFLEPSDSAIALFEYEYDLPVLPPELAAELALFGETLLPVLLVLGLASRFGALGLMGMTLVIQVFVYPTHFMEHGTWLAALLPVLMLGGGKISLDQVIFRREETK